MAYEGGCFCRNVRYRVDSKPLRVMHCHCSICRRVSAAPVVTWITFPTKDLVWTQGKPSKLKSTPEASRHFCSDCGSHMVFEVDGAKELDITLASLDEHDDIEVGYHIFNDTRVKWLKLSDGLPEYDDWGPDV